MVDTKKNSMEKRQHDHFQSSSIPQFWLTVLAVAAAISTVAVCHSNILPLSESTQKFQAYHFSTTTLAKIQL